MTPGAGGLPDPDRASPVLLTTPQDADKRMAALRGKLRSKSRLPTMPVELTTSGAASTPDYLRRVVIARMHQDGS